MLILEMESRNLDKILSPYRDTHGTGIYEDFNHVNGSNGNAGPQHISLDEAGIRLIPYSLAPYSYPMIITEISYDISGNGTGERLYIGRNGSIESKHVETKEFISGETLLAIKNSIPSVTTHERLIMVTCNDKLIGRVGHLNQLYEMLLKVGMATKHMKGFLANINIIGITMAESHIVYEALIREAKEYEK